MHSRHLCAGAGNSKQMRVVNLAPFPGNAWGDAYTVVQVQVAEHQYVADRGAIYGGLTNGIPNA